MTFTLIFKDISEERDIPKENYTIKDLLNDLELSSQTIVPKQNGELVIEESEMKKLDYRVRRKKEIYKIYQELLQDVKEVKLFEQDIINTTPWFYDILAENRDELQKYLKEKNIGTRLMYGPINKQIAYQIPGEHEVSNLVGQKGLWLPSFTQITDDEIKYVCEMIKQFYSKHSL